MAQEYFPFDSGAGGSITETQWRRMARLWANAGVETGLTVTNGTGSNVNLAAGSAWVDGHYYRTDSTVAVAFTPNVLAVPQTVYVVLELDPTANTITPKCITTTPSQNPTGVYQFLLYTFTLPPSGTAQTLTGLTDRRMLNGVIAPAAMTSGGFTAGTTWTLPDSNPVIAPLTGWYDAELTLRSQTGSTAQWSGRCLIDLWVGSSPPADGAMGGPTRKRFPLAGDWAATVQGRLYAQAGQEIRASWYYTTGPATYTWQWAVKKA